MVQPIEADVRHAAPATMLALCLSAAGLGLSELGCELVGGIDDRHLAAVSPPPGGCDGGGGCECDGGGGCEPTCPTGFADCDGKRGGGCTTPVTSDPMNCGACGKPCSGVCYGGKCAGPVLPANILSWYRADKDALVTQAGLVTHWTDQLGGEATQPFESQAPTYVPASDDFGGMPALRFDGVGDYLQLHDGYDDFTQGLTLFFAVYPTTVNDYTLLFLGVENELAANSVYLDRFGGTTNLRYEYYDVNENGASVDASEGIVPGVAQVISVVHDWSPLVRVFNNGKPLATSVNGSFPPAIKVLRTNNLIGVLFDKAHFFQGQLAEVILYARPLDDVDRAVVQNYLLVKYGIPPG